jgi:hypothetical protein
MLCLGVIGWRVIVARNAESTSSSAAPPPAVPAAAPPTASPGVIGITPAQRASVAADPTGSVVPHFELPANPSPATTTSAKVPGWLKPGAAAAAMSAKAAAAAAASASGATPAPKPAATSEDLGF